VNTTCITVQQRRCIDRDVLWNGMTVGGRAYVIFGEAVALLALPVAIPAPATEMVFASATVAAGATAEQVFGFNTNTLSNR
jgi:hypothetical protein